MTETERLNHVTDRRQRLNVLLVDLGTPREELNEPIGVEVLAGKISQRFGDEVAVHLECLQLQPESSIEHVNLNGFDILGFSVKLYSLDRFRGITRRIPGFNLGEKGPIVLAGDLLPTFGYREMLMEFPQLFCVLGEGERPLVDIIQLVRENGAATSGQLAALLIDQEVPNLAFKVRDNIVPPHRSTFDVSMSAQPSRTLLREVIQRHGIVRIEASRGCPWGKCSFCAIGVKYGVHDWRPFPVEAIIEDLRRISEAGGRSPYFTDEDFIGSDPDRATYIARRIQEEKRAGSIASNLDFYLNLPVGAVIMHENVLAQLKAAGLREVFIGIESGAKAQLNRYRKKASTDKNIQALNVLRRLGLEIDIGFIMFDPEMTLRDLKENLSFLEEAGITSHDARDLKWMRVEPGTTLAANLLTKGVAHIPMDLNSLTYPYDFVDPAVGQIAEVFRTWEEGHKALTYRLQGELRGEVPDRRTRQEKKALLGRFRQMDYEFLKECVALLDDGAFEEGSIKELKAKCERTRVALTEAYRRSR